MKSLYQEAKEGLISLCRVTVISFALWIFMLLITQGRPSGKVVIATVIFNIAGVATLEARRARANRMNQEQENHDYF